MTQEMTKEDDIFSQSTDSNVDKIFEKDDLTLNEIFKIRRWVRHSPKELDSFRSKLDSNASSAMKTKDEATERDGIAKWVLNEFTDARGVLAGTKTELAHCFNALCMKEEGQPEEALAYLNELPADMQSGKNVMLMKLKLMYCIGVFDEDADKLVDTLEKKHADDIETLKVKGMYLECGGNPGAAVDIYKQVLAAEPADEEVLFCLAVLLDRIGEDEEALKYYEKAADIFPVHVNAVLNLGQVYYENGENEKAIFCFKRILRQHPDHKFAQRFVKDISATENMYYDEKKAKQVEELNKKLQIPVTDFELSVRSRNCLSQMNIKTLGDLIQKTEADLLSYKNFGETSLAEIKRMLSSKGLYLGMAKDMEDQELREKQKRQITDEASSEILEKSIDTLELSVRAGKCLEKLGMKTLGDIVKYDEVTLLKVRNFGQTSLNEIKKKLAIYNLSLKNE